MRSKYVLLLVLALCLIIGLQASAQEKQTSPKPKAEAAEETDSDEELRRAIEGAGGSEKQILINLDAYLKKFPNSRRRIEIERELYKLSLELRDRDRAITYAEKLVSANARDLETLTALVSLLRERKAEGDLTKALRYADQLIEQVEAILAGDKPARLNAAQWADRKGRGLASVYLLRGQVYADLSNREKAEADLRKSYQSSRLAATALALGELAEKRNAASEAIDYYAQAFALSIEGSEGVDRKEVRRKLGQLYAATHGSEAGLGDRLLKVYDERVAERAARAAQLEQPNINAGVTDPFLFKLTRLDGSAVKLGDFRGKVIVLNFWATWCGPCLVEAPLFEKAIARYKNDGEVVFLALNTDEDRALVEPFLKEQKWKLPIAYADYLNEHYEVSSIPTTIIIDRQGQVSFRQAGFNPREDFVAALSEKIEAARKK
jgi:thiol-disulfide isomerase/thioredoxin